MYPETVVGRERVHRLRAGDPRNRLQREARDSALGELLEAFRVRERLQQSDQHRSLPQQRDLLLARLLHLDDDLGAEDVTARGDLRARFDIGRVREGRRLSRALFDEYFKAFLGETRDRLGNERDAVLALGRLLRDRDLHRRNSIGVCAATVPL